jgi:hypothetical protein
MPVARRFGAAQHKIPVAGSTCSGWPIEQNAPRPTELIYERISVAYEQYTTVTSDGPNESRTVIRMKGKVSLTDGDDIARAHPVLHDFTERVRSIS